MRGGLWYSPSDYMRGAYRGSFGPSGQLDGGGFRCVSSTKTLTPTSKPSPSPISDPVFVFSNEKDSGLCLFGVGSSAASNESGKLIWIDIDLSPGGTESHDLPPGYYMVNSYWDYDKSPSAPKWSVEAEEGQVCYFRCIDSESGGSTSVSDCGF